MNKYPLGRDILVSWSLDLGGQPVDEFLFEYNCAGGTKAVSDFNISNGILTWNFPGEEQHAYGVYGLHLIALSGGEKVAEFKLKDAFEIIHGTPADEEQSVPLESSVETEQEPFEPEEPEETIPNYVSQAPLHVEKVPLGSNIILNWRLLSAEIFDFPLEQCQLDLFYAAAGSGYNRAEDYELKTDDGYVLQWNFAADKQVRFGLYSLFLDIHYNGERIATLVREAAFSLVHRSGSGILPDRIISFESVVTTLGGGALYALADVVNDGYSTVYRNDGSTPAASGDSLVFNGEKWAASNALLLALQDLRSQIDAVSRRVDGTDFDLDGLSSRLDGAISAIEQNTAWIQSDEDSIAQLIIDANRILASVEDIYGNIAQLEITSSSISTRVSNAEGDISSLQQTAQGFDLRVSNAEGDIGELYLTAEGFGTRISDAEGNISTLEQTAESLTSSIEDAEGNISVLQQTATTLTSAISDAEGNISVLQQTAAGLESRVSNAEGDISTISQTAESIQLQVDSQSGDIATLQVSARGLTSRVSNAEGDISTLDQRADAIEVSVQGLSTEITRYEGVTDAALRNMQDQIDGVIETWYYSGVPTLNNLPASQWSAAEMANHVGDLYYDKNTGKAYRFMLDNTQTPAVYVWVELADEDIAKALALAGEKKRVFVTTPYAPYDAGDLWVRQKTVGGNTVNEIWRCKTSRAADASPSFLESEWESADNFGYVVNKSNLEVLSDAIVGQVTQITYNTDGTVSTEAKSAIEANARSVRISTVVDNVAYAGISIDSTNHTGSVTIFSDNFYVKAPQGNKTALSIINQPNGNSVIDVASLNVSGIFTTSAWTSEESALQGYADAAAGDAQTAAEGYADTKAGEAETNAKNYANSTAYLNEHVLPMIQQETSGLAVDSDYSYLKTALENQTTALGGLMLTSLIQLGATQSGSSWTVNSGISGIYDSTKRGNGIAAWFGGPMVDHLASPATTPYASSLFRMDGSGYLAGGEIQWGASGELIIHGTSAATPITIENAELKDGNKTLSVGDLILNIEDLLELKSWFVKETYDPGDGQTHYRLKLVGSSTGIEGLHVEGHILSDDDQIVGGGTPGGGGGGGAQYLTDLLDVYPSTKPSAQKILVFDPNQNDKNGNSGAWVYANIPTGSVTSVAGVSPANGDIPVASLQTAIGLGDYVSKSGDTMTGDLQLKNSSLRFLDDNGNIAGWLTWGGSDKQPKWYDTSGSTAALETIWHSGNASISNSAITLGSTSLGTSTAPIGWADAIPFYHITTEASITQDGLRLYSGSGSNWAGSVASMAYAAILAIGSPSRGWQMWASRIGSGANALFWRNGLADMSGWAAGRVIYDSGNANRSDVAWACSTLTVSTSVVSPELYAKSDAYPRLVFADSTQNRWIFSKRSTQNHLHLIRYTSAQANDTVMAFDYSAGNVGIGTTSPGYKFHVYGTSGATITPMSVFEHTGDYQWNCPTSFLAPNVTAGHSVSFGIGKAASTKNEGSLEFYYAGNSSDSNLFGLGLFGVDYVLTVSGGGNVGVGLGTTAPAYKLEVNGPTNNWASRFNGGTATRIYLAGADGDGLMIHTKGSTASYYALYCSVAETTLGTVATPALVVRATGNVGIGTGTPAYKLDVNGTIGITSTGPAINSTTATGVWNYIRLVNANTSTNYWDIATINTTSTFIGQANAFEIRDGLSSYSGISIRHATSAYGKLVVTVPSGECSIGFWSTSNNPISGRPIWVMGYKGSNNEFGWYNTNGTEGWRMTLTSAGALITTGDQVISSDINLKTNLKDITLTSEQIANAPAVSFDWKDGHGHSFGSIAQYWKPIVPEAVLGEEGSYTLAYGQLGTVLGINNGKAIFKLEQHETEQDKEIRKLKARVRDLEKQLKMRS